MTIDESITKYKEIANTDANCPAHCNISCDKCVQESKQLAEWLEELKQYRAIDTVEECLENKKFPYNMRKITKILLNVLKFIFAVLLFIALLTVIIAWSAIG